MRERFEEIAPTGQLHVHGEIQYVARTPRERKRRVRCPATHRRQPRHWSCGGTIRSWFRLQGYDPLVPGSLLPGPGALLSLLGRHPVLAGFVISLATCAVIGLVFLVAFRCCLRPRLIQHVQQQKQQTSVASSAAAVSS